MKDGLKPGDLEKRLLLLPFERMIATLEAIDELDALILEMLENESPNEVGVWQTKIAHRRTERARFVAFRLFLETKRGLHGAY